MSFHVAGAFRGLPRARVYIQAPNRRTVERLIATGAIEKSLFDDVQEHVCEQLRFNVYAEWSDPRERVRVMTCTDVS